MPLYHRVRSGGIHQGQILQQGNVQKFFLHLVNHLPLSIGVSGGSPRPVHMLDEADLGSSRGYTWCEERRSQRSVFSCCERGKMVLGGCFEPGVVTKLGFGPLGDCLRLVPPTNRCMDTASYIEAQKILSKFSLKKPYDPCYLIEMNALRSLEHPRG